jgi:hypothetical protein
MEGARPKRREEKFQVGGLNVSFVELKNQSRNLQNKTTGHTKI